MLKNDIRFKKTVLFSFLMNNKILTSSSVESYLNRICYVLMNKIIRMAFLFNLHSILFFLVMFDLYVILSSIFAITVLTPHFENSPFAFHLILNYPHII